MSRTVDDWPESPQGRPPIYPWDEWMNGQIWELKQGEDFQSTLKSFRVHVHKVARQNNMKAVTQFQGKDIIMIHFYTPEV